MIRRALAICVVMLCLATPRADAHEVRPAYLEIVEQAPETYQIAWKQPAVGEVRLSLVPVFPASCAAVDSPTLVAQPSSTLTRWRLRCAGGLQNKSVRIAGLDRTLTSAIVRVSWADGRAFSDVARPATPALTLRVAARPGLPGYLRLGFEHILSGYDHMLFVIGLIVLAQGAARLFLAVTAFTLAHSITLGASALGAIGLPQKSVEAAIALSILALGYEIARLARGRTGLTHAAPWIVAFGFGLLHGFGFASALSEIGLPRHAKLGALFLFNAGVECGQLLIVAGALPLVLWFRSGGGVARARFELTMGYAIGIAGAFWMIARITAILRV